MYTVREREYLRVFTYHFRNRSVYVLHIGESGGKGCDDTL